MTLTSIRDIDLFDDFEVPAELEAKGPAESRGIPRDGVRLMISDGSDRRHVRFDQLISVLRPGDLLVVNNSMTLPASVRSGEVVVNFSAVLPGGLQVVELRRPSGPGTLPWEGEHPSRIALPGGITMELLTPFPVDSSTGRLWVAGLDSGGKLHEYLARWGEPIRYGHADSPHPLPAYQTVFATTPGSAEMPSAGRPFTRRLVTELISAGITLAPITLHTGVSSLETGEAPYPEWFEVPAATAALVDHTGDRGGRVIAVGTTVVRALETTADHLGRSHPGRGWTDLVVTADHPMRVVDGLITGWHDPSSTHLDMLRAFIGRAGLADAHGEALSRRYLWHEFGDSHLMLRS